MKKTSLFLLGTVIAVSAATVPQGFEMWPGSQLQELGKQLSSKVDAHHAALQQLAKYDNHGVLLVHREGNGEAELHETQVDLFFVESGQATLVIGGAMVEGRTTAPHEIRGPSIQGGDTRKLGVGDVVHIPAGVPHQVLVESGKKFDYVVVKVDVK